MYYHHVFILLSNQYIREVIWIGKMSEFEIEVVEAIQSVFVLKKLFRKNANYVEKFRIFQSSFLFVF